MNQGYEKIRFDDLKQCFDDKSAPFSDKEGKKNCSEFAKLFDAFILTIWLYKMYFDWFFLKHGMAINYTKIIFFLSAKTRFLHFFKEKSFGQNSEKKIQGIF